MAQLRQYPNYGVESGKLDAEERQVLMQRYNN